MFFDFGLYITTLTILSFITMPFFRTKNQFKLYLISIIYFSFFALLHYYLSMSVGKEGFSILTKDLLDDEIIYHNTAIYLCQGLSIQDIMQAQQKLVGYTSIKSIFFSSIISIFYFLLAPKIIVAKAIVVYFSSIFIPLFYTVLKKFIDYKYAYRFSLLILLYPSYLIHAIQIEKDSFVLVLFIIVLNQIVNGFLNKRMSSILVIAIIIILFLFRPQYSVLLIIIIFLTYLLRYKIFYYRTWLFYILIVIVLMPLPVLFLKYYLPDTFLFLDATKRYSVFAGTVGFLEHDYSSYSSILSSLLLSSYYFIFGPISSYILNASIMWKVLLIEPLVYVFLPLYFLLLKFYRSKINNDTILKFILILFISILVYIFISVVFESNFSSYLRKRMIVYILLFMIAILLNRKKYIKKYKHFKSMA